MKVLAICLFALLAAASAAPKSNLRLTNYMPRVNLPFGVKNGLVGPRIIGGEDASVGEFPYQVSYQWGILGAFQHVCGGSILNENWIVTAGHCVTEVPTIGEFQIIAGILKLDTTQDAQVISVVEKIVNPNYEGGVNPNDIALLRLATPLVLNDNVQAVKLPVADAVAEGEATLSGWGLTNNIIPLPPNTLQKIDLPIVAIEDCAQALVDLLGESAPLDAKSNVCTGPLDVEGISACSGDSGGPLAQNGTLVGVVSWGITPCGSKGAPSVYTNVANFVSFINDNVNKS